MHVLYIRENLTLTNYISIRFRGLAYMTAKFISLVTANFSASKLFSCVLKTCSYHFLFYLCSMSQPHSKEEDELLNMDIGNSEDTAAQHKAQLLRQSPPPRRSRSRSPPKDPPRQSRSRSPPRDPVPTNNKSVST